MSRPMLCNMAMYSGFDKPLGGKFLRFSDLWYMGKPVKRDQRIVIVSIVSFTALVQRNLIVKKFKTPILPVM